MPRICAGWLKFWNKFMKSSLSTQNHKNRQRKASHPATVSKMGLAMQMRLIKMLLSHEDNRKTLTSKLVLQCLLHQEGTKNLYQMPLLMEDKGVIAIKTQWLYRNLRREEVWEVALDQAQIGKWRVQVISINTCSLIRVMLNLPRKTWHPLLHFKWCPFQHLTSYKWFKICHSSWILSRSSFTKINIATLINPSRQTIFHPSWTNNLGKYLPSKITLMQNKGSKFHA